MKPGESFKWEDEELWVVKTARGGCSQRNIACKFADHEKGKCTAPKSAPRCRGVIFVTQEQYLTLRLLGST